MKTLIALSFGMVVIFAYSTELQQCKLSEGKLQNENHCLMRNLAPRFKMAPCIEKCIKKVNNSLGRFEKGCITAAFDQSGETPMDRMRRAVKARIQEEKRQNQPGSSPGGGVAGWPLSNDPGAVDTPRTAGQ